MSKFIIKNRNGLFVNRNSEDSKKLDYFRDTDLDVAEQYSESEIEVLKERLKGTWHTEGFEVFEVITCLKPVNPNYIPNR